MMPSDWLLYCLAELLRFLALLGRTVSAASPFDAAVGAVLKMAW